MKKFLGKISIFIIPLILFFGLPCYFLIKYKENFNSFTSFPSKNDKVLIGYKYNESNYDYLKWKASNLDNHYTILALGSSRILQFRKEMFNDSFYNAGFAVKRLNEFLPFLKSLKNSNQPKYLLISLDQWMFNYNWDKLETQANIDNWETSFQYSPKLSIINATWKDIFDGNFETITNSTDGVRRIGLNAYINETGFRNDGSFYYGKQIAKKLQNDSTMADFKFRETISRINKGNNRFEYGSDVNIKAILELKRLLSYCKEHKIRLVAFLPPFSDVTNQYMSKKNKYDYMHMIYPKIAPLFFDYGFELYDFTNLSSCKSNDNEVIDGFHGGEVTYLRMLIAILEKNSSLNAVSNITLRKIELNNRINNYMVYNCL